ncbi:subtilisin-like protein [Coprinopsis marcescibilis]|uniref:Subtilisin-like protein n=1 Tax=Coprinopsis marcescibilis TaxID=230819 RepID=A0A5C3KMG1_COPMA|nr:subtilisin-like protein [Coprinopsis marcescibilis]
MKFFIALAATLVAFATVSTALAAPQALVGVETVQGQTTGRHIIQFKSRSARRAWARRLRVSAEWDIINGVAANLDTSTLAELRASQDVQSISVEGYASTAGSQSNAPWGLQRITQSGPLANQIPYALTYNYNYDDTAGVGVDVYVVDTGLQHTHNEFGGRARFGHSYLGGTTGSDPHGHGTHCGGTVAGSRFGVAKRANLISVQVLGADGFGAWSWIISGLNWVLSEASSSGRPSVVTMSIVGGGTTAVDDAVAALVAAGVHVVVAAGNANDDAGLYSPARAPSAITVGASTIDDSRAGFSNYGPIVDVFAPGQAVISSWIGSDSATAELSGTSMATPHVAGLVAYFIAKDGNLSPAAMSDKIKSYGVNGVLTNIPTGTVNDLAQIAPGAPTPPPVTQPQRIHPGISNGKCLDVRQGTIANGTPVQLYDCNGTTAQVWLISRGATKVRLANTNFCLDASSPTPANGTGMKIWQCTDNVAAQEWTYTANNRITLRSAPQCLDLPSGNLVNGIQIQTWQCADNITGQSWTVSNA